MPHKLPRGLYALLDDSVRSDLSMIVKAKAVIEAGVGVLQLRLKNTADRVALPLIREVMALARPRRVLVVINDRVDLTLAGGADGVHLGADDLPIDVARKLLGPEALIGATTRSLEGIFEAERLGADHVGLGPVFSTTTKVVAHTPLGLEAFGLIARQSPLPVVGIAGITLENIGQVAVAGAWCAAVAGDLLKAEDLVSRARALQGAFSGSR